MSSKSPTAGKSSPTRLGEQGEQQKKKTDGTKVPRKRTKTGCLTCRKRRIKCDEAKPGCGNCEKSRRNCEGYNARIVFRRSRTNPSADGSDAFQVPFQVPVDNNFAGFHSAPQGFAFPDAQQSYFHPAQGSHPHEHDAGNPFMADMHSPEEDRRISWQHPTHEYDRMSAGYHPPSEVTLNPYPHHQRAPMHHNFDNVGSNAGFDRMAGQQDAGMHSFHPQVPRLHTGMASGRPAFLDQSSPLTFSHSSGDHSGMGYYDPYSASTASSFITPSSAYGSHTGAYQKTHDSRQGPNARTSIYSDQSLLELEARLASHASKQMYEADSSKARKAVPLSLGRLDTTQILEAAAVEVEDDDYYDVKSDEEDEVVATKAMAANAQPEPKLGMVRDLYNQHSDDLGIRTMDAFITPGFIDVYRPERAANPLKNEATARVFAHFITSTGPLISPFERYHGAQSSMLRSGSLASATKSLWTHTLPMMALHNQGLLHAMLAMSSMHMAKLSGASTAPSFKHYAWSIKRVHKAVSQNRQRHEVTTLAATLLLAFYEVMTADHLNWTKHLMGARQLIKEIDFGRLLRRIRKAKSSQNDRPVKAENNESFLSFRDTFQDSETSYLDKFHDMDYHTVGYFMGYDIHRLQGHVDDGKGGRSTADEAPLREVDFHNFEILQSLFWWYCKQDIVHAALAGTPPLQSYDFWAACPPRAPPGDLEAVCGSFDYLTLALGRIVNFNGQDKARKLKTPSKGPPSIPGQKMPGGPAQASGTPSGDAPKQAVPPIPFYGMAPIQESARPHNAYGDDVDTGKAPLTPDPTVSATSSYDEDTDRALEEWQRIQTVLDVFPTLLGPAFEPLAKGEYLDAETPFGPLIMYRRYDIACLWMFYHMARIMHARAHPSMPAAAILAVPTAAKYTAEDALTIGRIAASVTLNLSGAPLHPALAGAFTDSILPLFWAGIQYNDAAQRAWTIRRLLDIEDHTGYASASMCALGCETSWTRAAERGGPPYVRQAELSIPHDVRVKADIAGRQRSELFGLSRTAGQAIPFGASAYGAIGVLGTIEDLKAMSLAEEKLL